VLREEAELRGKVTTAEAEVAAEPEAPTILVAAVAAQVLSGAGVVAQVVALEVLGQLGITELPMLEAAVADGITGVAAGRVLVVLVAAAQAVTPALRVRQIQAAAVVEVC
jgi:hypothetical protein